MPEWEYRIVRLRARAWGMGDFPPDLDDIGSDEWELVSVVVDPDNKKSLLAFFKRPFDYDEELGEMPGDITLDETKEH